MLRKWIFVCALAALVPAAAHAQGTLTTAVGPRLGFSSGPSSLDQIVVGGQVELGEIAPDLTLTPNLELGFGDDFTIIQLNGDVHYHFTVSGSAWRPYVGGGLGLAFISFDAPPGFNGDDSSTEAGLNIIGGAIVPTQSGSRFFTELKLGIGDIPDLKVLVGWTFGL
jgi:hypothetical protein